MSSTPENISMKEVASKSTVDDAKPTVSTAPIPVDSETLKRAAAMTSVLETNKVSRGVTMRPSGKWQAQFYYAGKSRYIGVFDTREKAALAYEIVRERLKSTPIALSLQQVDDIFQSATHSAEVAFPLDVATSIAKSVQSSGLPNVTLPPPPWPMIQNTTSHENDSSRQTNAQSSTHHGPDDDGKISSSIKKKLPTLSASADTSIHPLPTKSSAPTSAKSTLTLSSPKSWYSDSSSGKNPGVATSSSLLTAKARGLKRNHAVETYRFLFYRDKMEKSFADGCVIISEGQEILDETFESLIDHSDSNVKRVFSLTPSESLQIRRSEAIIQVLCGNVKFTLDTFRRLYVRDLLSMFSNKREINIIVIIESIQDEEEELSYVFSKRNDRSPVHYM